MNDESSSRCPRCDAPIAADAVFRLCPACLMSGALGPSEDDAAPATPESEAFPRELGGYRLLGLLGTGGMGTVYEAEQTATGRRVALKMLDHRLDSPDLRQRFLREGRLAASVNHPNSLYIFGSEEIGDTPVITMEIAGGGTLQDRLDKRGPLPVPAAVDAILDVISGLEAAYAGGVLHRDVKPSNCFVGPDGSVKVGDFGLSVSTLATDDSYATASGVILGTPAFAAPEQLRGDDLSVRADIYSVGATLYTLLTDRAPFEGKNAVQVVANAVNHAPKPLRELREEVLPDLERVVARCLAKEPEGRYEDYPALRDALLPFCSRQPEPASLAIRASSGWIDFLIAFLVPYVPLMLLVGNEQFHLGFLMERTLPTAVPYLALIAFGLLYFTIAEGWFGGGPGKRLKGLRIVQRDGRRPGLARGLIRILVIVASVEGVRIPLLLATIASRRIDDMTTFEIVMYSVSAAVLPWIPVLLSLTARRENGFATLWDLVSGTRVVVRQKGAVRPFFEPTSAPGRPAGDAASIGPYRIERELIPGEWLVAFDPLLRRPVWLLRRTARDVSLARRNVGRSGRMRWLQSVETANATWDAFEATPGTSFSHLIEGGKRVPWGTLRHWLLDLSTELWSAARDGTLPDELGPDHVFLSVRGRAILLDAPWPDVSAPAERVPVGDIAGQQRFLAAVAACVDSTGLPLHARPVLANLEEGRFEKLSFLTGTLRGQLDRPATVSGGIRAASVFLLPAYVWLMIFLGAREGAEWLYEWVGSSTAAIAMATTLAVLAGSAAIQLLALPFGTSIGHATFRLAVVDDRGTPASRSRLLARWAIVWLPLFLALSLVALLAGTTSGAARGGAAILILAWIAAATCTVARPHRGPHDRVARTWVVRR